MRDNPIGNREIGTSPWRWYRVGRLVIAALAGLAAFALARGLRQPNPAPPEIPSLALEPAVQAVLTEARSRVVAQPRDPEAWGRYGQVLFAHRLSAEAATCFEQAARLDPREPRWPYLHGILLTNEKPDLAAEDFRRAVSLAGSRNFAPQLRLGDLLLQLGKPAEAMAVYHAILEYEPGHPLAQLGLARAMADEQRWSEALEPLAAACTHPITRKAAGTLRASVYLRLGEASRASEDSQRVLALPPDVAGPDPYLEEIEALQVDRRSLLKRADQLLQRGRGREALQLLQQLVEESPDFDAGWRALGFTLLEQRAFAAAEQALRRSVDLAPESCEAHDFLGVAYLNQGARAQAVASLRRAIELKPDYAMAHYHLGQCLSTMGDKEGAQSEFEAALRCRPNLAEAHRDLALLLLEERRYGEARDHAERAVQLAPTDQPALELLTRIQNASPGEPKAANPSAKP